MEWQWDLLALNNLILLHYNLYFLYFSCHTVWLSSGIYGLIHTMGADTFICGECQMTFHDINAFLKHKNTNCQNKQKVMVCKVDDAAQDETQAEQEEVEEEIDVEGTTGDDETQTVLQMVDGSGEHQTVSRVVHCCLFLSCETWNLFRTHCFNFFLQTDTNSWEHWPSSSLRRSKWSGIRASWSKSRWSSNSPGGNNWRR